MSEEVSSTGVGGVLGKWEAGGDGGLTEATGSQLLQWDQRTKRVSHIETCIVSSPNGTISEDLGTESLCR